MEALHPIADIGMASGQGGSFSVVNHQFSFIQEHSEHVPGPNGTLLDRSINMIYCVSNISEAIRSSCDGN